MQYVVCDVTDEGDVSGRSTSPTAPTGRLDILFACAGGSLHRGPIVASDAAALRSTVDLNLSGTFLCIKHAAAAMIARAGGGSIVGMSSIAGHMTHRFMSAYCASKAGIEMLVKYAAEELGETASA